jgi:hypothetical protein
MASAPNAAISAIEPVEQTCFHWALLAIWYCYGESQQSPVYMWMDGSYLSAVDELGEGDVGVATEGVDDLEVAVGGTVLELDAEVVARVVLIATAELDRKGRSKVG